MLKLALRRFCGTVFAGKESYHGPKHTRRVPCAAVCDGHAIVRRR